MRGYTLIELIVSVGLFAIIMLLASGAYLMMISVNQQAQNMTTGIDNLSFAIESITHTIRTGSAYSCGASLGVACANGAANTEFTFKDENSRTVTYSLSGGAIHQLVNGQDSSLTDPLSVTITGLTFYAFDTPALSSGDTKQARVTVSISGTTQAGPGKPAQNFTIQTGATMRGSDL